MKKYNISIERTDVTKPSEKWYEKEFELTKKEFLHDIEFGRKDGLYTLDTDLFKKLLSLVERRTIEECVGEVGKLDSTKRKGLWLKTEHEKEDCVNMGYDLAKSDILSTLRGLIK